MSDTVRKNLGIVTAYAYARSKGYEGTEEEFAELMASYADVAEEAAQSASEAAQSAVDAAESESAAAGSALSAQQSAQAAAGLVETAQAAKTGAEQAAGAAENSANTAAGRALAASGFADAAEQSATNASGSATAAAGSATAAAASAEEAAESARTLTIDDTLTQQGQAAEAKKTGDEISELKVDLNDVTDFLSINIEHIISINGYNINNNDSTYIANSPFILNYDTTNYGNSNVIGIKLFVSQTGRLSIGTIKKTDLVIGNDFDQSILDVKEVFTINHTGEQYIKLNNPFNVDSDEYIFICVPNDTCRFKYGSYGIDKRFAYVNSGKFEQSTRSLGINVYIKRVTEPDKKYNEIYNDVTALNTTINKTSIIALDGYNENNQTNGTFGTAPFIPIKDIGYKYFVTAVTINVRETGFVTIGKIKKSDATGTYDASKITIHEVLQIHEIGLQTIELTTLMEVNTDEYITYGLPSDTLTFYYGTNGTDKRFNYVINGMYAVSSSSVNIIIHGVKIETIKELSTYNGKTISILGDSISTFSGYIPEENATYYPSGTVTQVTDTWWKKLIDALGMVLNVNNSWSGSRVTTTGGDTSAGCMSRCQSLGETPDVIIIWMGINDFNNEVALGTYDGKSSIPETTTTFREAYGIMLNKILTAYPYSEVWVCTLPQCERNENSGFPEINGNGIPLADFNEAILELARAFGVKVLDHNKSGLTYQNMPTFNPDNLHPNKYGHSLIANNDIWQMDNIIRTRYPLSD